jgi:predicted alpha/beta superfamily hydrolase
MRALAVLVFAAVLAGCAGTVPYALEDTRVETFFSSDGVRVLRLMISLPRNYDSRTKESFPVIYLLDADYSFAVARNELRHFTDRGQLKEAIVIGIGYPGAGNDIDLYHRTRVRDYTPTYMKGSGYGPGQDELSGHAREFLGVLEGELLPDIDRRFRTDPSARMLVGHSYGGLFATWTMLTRPGLFRDYVIVSPSLWYDDKTIFRLADAYIAANKDLAAHVFYGVGSFEGGGSLESSGAMAKDLQDFDAKMRAAKFPNYRSTVHVFEDETHNSVFPAAMSRGLRTIYDFAGEN